MPIYIFKCRQLQNFGIVYNLSCMVPRLLMNRLLSEISCKVAQKYKLLSLHPNTFSRHSFFSPAHHPDGETTDLCGETRDMGCETKDLGAETKSRTSGPPYV